MKTLKLALFNDLNLNLEDPQILDLSKITQITDPNFHNFLTKNYNFIYQQFNASLSSSFQIDLAQFSSLLDISDLNNQNKRLIKLEAPDLNFQPKNDRDYVLLLIHYFPQLGLVFKNIHLSAHTSLLVAEYILKKKINAQNFVFAKKYIDDINKQKWTRPQTDQEKQSGVSNLGSVSEKLLEKAFDTLIDKTNFFKTTSSEIQSYGDFVLMCLPNNLWISVKSNFARERLLASGYTTDILGVGFFTDSKEFTSYSKVRNFQRVGFLAMYLPDIPITEQQVAENISTFKQVQNKFIELDKDFPKNINGTDFYRPLSQIYNDLQKLLSKTEVSKRTTISF